MILFWVRWDGGLVEVGTGIRSRSGEVPTSG